MASITVKFELSNTQTLELSIACIDIRQFPITIIIYYGEEWKEGGETFALQWDDHQFPVS